MEMKKREDKSLEKVSGGAIYEDKSMGYYLDEDGQKHPGHFPGKDGWTWVENNRPFRVLDAYGHDHGYTFETIDEARHAAVDRGFSVNVVDEMQKDKLDGTK